MSSTVSSSTVCPYKACKSVVCKGFVLGASLTAAYYGVKLTLRWLGNRAAKKLMDDLNKAGEPMAADDKKAASENASGQDQVIDVNL